MSLYFSDSDGCVLRRGKDHSHPPDHAMCVTSILTTNMRKRAREELTAIPQIYEQERKKLVTCDMGPASPQRVASQLKLYHGMRSQLYRQRQKKVPQNPKEAADLQLDGEWTRTLTAENFLLVDSMEDDQRIIVFGTSTNLARVCSSDTILMDGTFSICPRIFYQLYIIHSLSPTGISLPELYCLLPNKTKITYTRLLRLIQTKAEEHSMCFSPKTVILDFELAVHNVLYAILPGSHVKGCLFHYGQALWRKLQELGLSSEYRQFDHIRHWFRLFIGLCFLPVPQVMNGFVAIQNQHTPNNDKCRLFNAYFLDTWLTGQFPIPLWNHFRTDVPRTNNNCEGYNSRLKKRACKAHLNIYELILLFKDEHANKEAYLLQINEGHRPAKRRRKYDDLDKNLAKLGLEYMLCEKDMPTYLSACGHLLSGYFEP